MNEAEARSKIAEEQAFMDKVKKRIKTDILFLWLSGAVGIIGIVIGINMLTIAGLIGAATFTVISMQRITHARIDWLETKLEKADVIEEDLL